MQNENALLNEKIKKHISMRFKDKNISHALLLECNDESILDISIKEIAKLFLCKNKDDGACFCCSDCKKIEKSIHPDVKEYRPESASKSLPIDIVRNIRKDAYIKPNEASGKVYILRDCDNMSSASSNALLKVLEEPPLSVTFILTCASSTSMLETIKSRCQIYSLNSSTFKDESFLEISKESDEMLSAILKKNESDILVAFSMFQKNRDLLFATLKDLEMIFHKALQISVGVKLESEYNNIYKLSDTLTQKSLICLIETCREYRKRLKLNANVNLLLTDLSIEFYTKLSL